ncbi:MAG: DUF4214 domain-containing protein [Oscillospiraceae bacterium]|nr:DUF4214 domain-containing protein [Oscillospiraceae bacterium]
MRWKKLGALLLCFALLMPAVPVRAGTYAENEAEVYRFLREDMGLNNAVACGILGNIARESRFDPAAEVIDVNGRISFGLVQWNGGRFEGLKNYCWQNGLDYKDLNAQLRFMKYELEGSENLAFRKLQGIPDTVQGAYTAGYNFARYYERCWSGYHHQRGRTACDPYYLHYTGDTWSRLVFFDPNGGDCGESVRVLAEGQSIGPLPAPSWGSNTFMGWYSAPSGGSLIGAGHAVGSGSTVLYARWSSSENFVKRLYRLCLGREPDEAGLRNWVAALQGGGLSGAQAAAGFFASDEYRGRNQSDEAFVDTLYAVLLDRGADAAGRATWLAHLRNGHSRCWVFSRFAACPEFQNLCAAYGIRGGSVGESEFDMGGGPVADDSQLRAFVIRLYECCLGRSPDSAGLENWTAHLLNGHSGREGAQGFVFSPECTGRSSNDGDFVIMLYNTLLDRGADKEGFVTWLGHLQSGQSRQWVFDGFCRSAEFQALCAAYGIRPY